MWLGQFNDSDDYMRLARVLDLLNGQDWYDLAQHRLSPADNFILPWSRLIDLPLAGMTLLFSPVLGQAAAIGAAAFMVPLLWLGGFLFILPLLGRGLLPQRYGWLLVLVALCSFPVLRELRPMRVDHHGAQLCFALAGLVTLQLYLLQPHYRWRLLTGLCAACGLAIGAESFLWTLLATAIIALHAAWVGGRASRDAPGFAAGLLGGLCLLLPVIRSPDTWFSHDLALPSLPHLLLAVLIGGVLGAVRSSDQISPSFPRKRESRLFFFSQQEQLDSRLRGNDNHKGRIKRLCTLFVSAVSALGLLLWALPELRDGIYAINMSPTNRELVLGSVLEAKSFAHRLAPMPLTLHGLKIYWPLIGHNLFLPVLACLTVLTQLWRTRHQRVWALWLLQAAFLLPMTMLALAWQSRLGTYMGLYAVLPIAWALAQIIRWVGQHLRRKLVRRVTQATLLLLLLPAPTVCATLAVLQARPAQMILFPSWFTPRPCDFKAVAAVLNDPHRFGTQPLNLMTSMSGGTEMLFRTRHRVFAAPYDVSGNALAMEFFGQRDQDAARRLAQTHSIDLVLMCDSYATLYLPDILAKTAAREAAPYLAQGQLVPDALNADRALVDHIINGDVPDWLQPIPLEAPAMHLYRVNL